MSDDDELAILKVAFAESVRKLGLPSDAANTIRSRAATVMATATAVAGFLGGLAFDRSPHGCQWALVTLAGIAYAGSMVPCLLVLNPRFGGWQSGQNTEKLANAAGTADAKDLKQVYRTLATDYQKGLEANEKVTRRLATMLSVAIVLMVVELVFLLWLLAATATQTASSLPVP
jgi:hypothetical protein